ncbi:MULTISPECIES: divalent cation tolerance protein CutA [unclassified Streptomyces]
MCTGNGSNPTKRRQLAQVSTATPEREQAVDLAKGAVQRRLAAGSQIIDPVGSVFWHAPAADHATGSRPNP